VERRERRRWSFAACAFDEANWSLTVDGSRVPIETKPLELLRELLLHAGNVVTKDELLDRIWPDVTVVEASLPTAVHKLRLALRDDRRDQAIIETVQGIGYRLAVPVKVEAVSAAETVRPFLRRSLAGGEVSRHERGAGRLPQLLFISGGLAIAFVAMAFAFALSQPVSASKATPFTQRDAANALRKLDVGTIETMLAAGWNPNSAFDREGNGAINYVLNICEWDREHDQEQMVLMVRTLIDGGARLDQRNVWGDTPYSIAKAVRYCGPNHPVTRSIRTMCYAGFQPLGDRCLASYEVERRDGQRNSVG
jgi:DNA-binding winged helix-turn-helix (wHTH) protein